MSKNKKRHFLDGGVRGKYSLQSFLSGARLFFNLVDLSGGISITKIIMVRIYYLAG